MIYITRRERFNAAHKLFREEWSDEQNLEIFGKCSNPNWHGHNYELFVTVKGEINPETGFVIDLKELKRIMSLPEDFILTGEHKKQSERIGRMVPPLMMKALAESVYNNVLKPYKEKYND